MGDDEKHKEGCCFWEQDEPGCPDWCDCGLVQNDNIPFWAKVEEDALPTGEDDG